MTSYTVDLTIKGTITGDGPGTPPVDPPVEPPVDPPVEPPPGAVAAPEIPPIPGDAIWCGPSKDIKEPADAIGTVPPGGTLVLEDARYVKPFHFENEGVTIRSAGGNPYRCYFDGQGGYGGGHRLAWGKGGFHTNKSARIIGIGFRNCGSPQSGTNYSNEGGIWIGDSDGTTPATVLVQRCSFDNNANGVFAAGEHNIRLHIAENLYGYIEPNGKNAALTQGGGPAHDNYVAPGELDVSHSYFWGCCNGHNVKSRSPKSRVHDNPCMTQDGGRAFEATDGGDAEFTNNAVHTRTDRPTGHYNNSNMLAYADESSSQGSQGMKMAGNILHVSRQNSTIWAAGGGTIASSGDTVKYYAQGSLQLQGNVTGLEQASAPPNAPPAPSLPQPPSWASVSAQAEKAFKWVRTKKEVRESDGGPDGWNETPEQDVSYLSRDG